MLFTEGNKMAKEKISITIDGKILKEVKQIIEKGKFRNRSHVIEYGLRKFLEGEK